MSTYTITKAVGGDRTHQLLAYQYTKQGLSPEEAMSALKQCKYTVKLANCTYKVQATSVASIMTGIAMAISLVGNGNCTITKTKGLKWAK